MEINLTASAQNPPEPCERHPTETLALIDRALDTAWGTRVPVKTLFEYLENNYSLEECLECFPSVTREMACRILESSESALLSPTAA